MLFEISFSDLKNITLKKEFVLIVVDLEVLKILKSWRHMCSAILFPNIWWTWRNGKESIQDKRLVYVIVDKVLFFVTDLYIMARRFG